MLQKPIMTNLKKILALVSFYHHVFYDNLLIAETKVIPIIASLDCMKSGTDMGLKFWLKYLENTLKGLVWKKSVGNIMSVGARVDSSSF